jgi:HSP20 family protein
MAYNYQQVPFWDFMRTFNNGAGVDHPAGAYAFFGPPGPSAGHAECPAGWGPHRGRGRRGHAHRGGSHERNAEGARSGSPNPENPEGEAGEESSHRHDHHGRRGGWGGRGGWGRGDWHGHGRGRAPPFGGPGGFDLSALFESLSGHPLAQAFRTYAEQASQRSGEAPGPDTDAENSFVPPVDVFATETEYVLHIALPGAKKEDVGVNFDADKGELNVAGVVYRPGDEEFLKSLTQSERRVGVFERTIKIPPTGEEKEEVDGDAIVAKMEDGVLIVTIPKVEKEWTDVKKVDID